MNQEPQTRPPIASDPKPQTSAPIDPGEQYICESCS